MTRFEVLKAVQDEELFASMIVEFVKHRKTPEAVAEALKEEITEEGLQRLMDIAQSDYPLSFQKSSAYKN